MAEVSAAVQAETKTSGSDTAAQHPTEAGRASVASLGENNPSAPPPSWSPLAHSHGYNDEGAVLRTVLLRACLKPAEYDEFTRRRRWIDGLLHGYSLWDFIPTAELQRLVTVYDGVRREAGEGAVGDEDVEGDVSAASLVQRAGLLPLRPRVLLYGSGSGGTATIGGDADFVLAFPVPPLLAQALRQVIRVLQLEAGLTLVDDPAEGSGGELLGSGHPRTASPSSLYPAYTTYPLLTDISLRAFAVESGFLAPSRPQHPLVLSSVYHHMMARRPTNSSAPDAGKSTASVELHAVDDELDHQDVYDERYRAHFAKQREDDVEAVESSTPRRRPPSATDPFAGTLDEAEATLDLTETVSHGVSGTDDVVTAATDPVDDSLDDIIGALKRTTVWGASVPAPEQPAAPEVSDTAPHKAPEAAAAVANFPRPSPVPDAPEPAPSIVSDEERAALLKNTDYKGESAVFLALKSQYSTEHDPTILPEKVLLEGPDAVPVDTVVAVATTSPAKPNILPPVVPQKLVVHRIFRARIPILQFCPATAHECATLARTKPDEAVVRSSGDAGETPSASPPSSKTRSGQANKELSKALVDRLLGPSAPPMAAESGPSGGRFKKRTMMGDPEAVAATSPVEAPAVEETLDEALAADDAALDEQAALPTGDGGHFHRFFAMRAAFPPCHLHHQRIQPYRWNSRHARLLKLVASGKHSMPIVSPFAWDIGYCEPPRSAGGAGLDGAHSATESAAVKSSRRPLGSPVDALLNTLLGTLRVRNSIDHFDVSLSLDGLRNTLLLREYFVMYPVLRYAIIVLKIWGKNKRVLQARSGWMSPYALSILFIHYCERAGVVPLLLPTPRVEVQLQRLSEALLQQGTAANEADGAGLDGTELNKGAEADYTNQWKSQDNAAEHCGQGTVERTRAAQPLDVVERCLDCLVEGGPHDAPEMYVNIGRLLRGFFRYYSSPSGFDFDVDVVDIRPEWTGPRPETAGETRGAGATEAAGEPDASDDSNGQAVERWGYRYASRAEWDASLDAERTTHAESWHRRGYNVVSIRDPFDHHCLGRSVEFFRAEAIKEEFRLAATASWQDWLTPP